MVPLAGDIDMSEINTPLAKEEANLVKEEAKLAGLQTALTAAQADLRQHEGIDATRRDGSDRQEAIHNKMLQDARRAVTVAQNQYDAQTSVVAESRAKVTALKAQAEATQ